MPSQWHANLIIVKSSALFDALAKIANQLGVGAVYYFKI